ncbi:unnamed protein product [Cuscuta campestris]|uniref:Uncharacterized protein n=1 Tax=Cuscuta campestris TaxID=132261 RepID=A0A484KIF9_9ASTE|nr:unnamed protein product [Cuscuta campestris]
MRRSRTDLLGWGLWRRWWLQVQERSSAMVPESQRRQCRRIVVGTAGESSAVALTPSVLGGEALGVVDMLRVN